MNERERYVATLLFQQPDRIPFQPGGGRESTLKAWREQGLPDGVTDYCRYAAELVGVTLPPPVETTSIGVDFRMRLAALPVIAPSDHGPFRGDQEAPHERVRLRASVAAQSQPGGGVKGRRVRGCGGHDELTVSSTCVRCGRGALYVRAATSTSSSTRPALCFFTAAAMNCGQFCGAGCL